MNDETKSRFQVKTEVVVVKDEGERSLEVSVDHTGVYIRTPGCGASMPVAILREALERAGVLETSRERRAIETLDTADRNTLEMSLCEVTKQRDSHKANVETLARDLAEARATVDRLSARLPLETALQCIDDIYNDIATDGEDRKPDAERFHEMARMRLRSLAGSAEGKAGRVLTTQEVAEADRAMYSAQAYVDALYWLESKGYLSVRLPPQE